MPWRLGERLTLADEYRGKSPHSRRPREDDERRHSDARPLEVSPQVANPSS
jgi:hypothetical protein